MVGCTSISIPNKITHSSATGLMLMDYSGSANGQLTSVDESSYFEFYEPLYAAIDTLREDQLDNPLSDAFSGSISMLNPLVLYSGYYTRTQWDDAYLNGSPENEGEANNLQLLVR